MIHIDDRFFPVVISHWYGPFGEAAIDAYFVQQIALAERAVQAGTWLVSIAPSGDIPSSADRKYIADRTRSMPAQLRERSIASFCIVESQIKRGVITALSWLIGDLSSLEPVASETEAIEGARRALQAKGIEFPYALTPEALRRAIDEGAGGAAAG